MPHPLIAIVGRANVGKSTLFNRFGSHRTSIVHDTPGVTRDRIYSHADWLGREVQIVDTGGIELSSQGEIELHVRDQGRLAQEEADVIIFVADNQEGLTTLDQEVISQLRKSAKPVFLAVNKVDHAGHEVMANEFYALGLGDVYPISAEHGYGVYELMEDVLKALPPQSGEEEKHNEDVVRVAVIGKPNVGKSSLVNRLLKSDRLIVSKIAGTTRDAVDTPLKADGKDYVLIDTAGIRRKGKTRQLLDKYSAIMSLKAMDRADVAMLIIDASQGVTDQDASIAGYALERGRGLLLVANKWDLADGEAFEALKEEVARKLRFLDYAPLYVVSAKTGRGIDRLLSHVHEVFLEYSKSIPTARLNECFEKALCKNPMSHYRGKFLKLFYTTQVKTRPPTFRCFVNYPEGIHFSYRRYLVNSLRQTFGFSGTPVHLIFTRKGEDR